MGGYLSCAPEEVPPPGFFFSRGLKHLKSQLMIRMMHLKKKKHTYTCHSLLMGCVGHASEEEKERSQPKNRSTATATGENVVKN